MAVDPAGNVYIIDDQYRVAKVDGKVSVNKTAVVKMLALSGYDCERTVPGDSNVVFRNAANNIAYMELGQG